MFDLVIYGQFFINNRPLKYVTLGTSINCYKALCNSFILYLCVHTSYKKKFLLMCLRYDIIHIFLRSCVIKVCYLRYFFITLNAKVNSGQCCVLECQKTNCIIDLFRM